MTHHGESLRRLTNDKLVDQLKSDYGHAPVSAADRVMLDYVAKLTRSPASTTEADVEALREAGFSDRAILDVVQIAAYFAFVTRLAEGLGVAIEEYWTEEQDHQ